MKHFLNHISPTLAAIARAFACEGIGHTHSYAEEIRTIERAWRKWHAEQLKAALEGVHGAVLERLMAKLEDLRSARELVAFIEAHDWASVDSDTRAIALFDIDRAIVALRERTDQGRADRPR